MYSSNSQCFKRLLSILFLHDTKFQRNLAFYDITQLLGITTKMGIQYALDYNMQTEIWVPGRGKLHLASIICTDNPNNEAVVFNIYYYLNRPTVHNFELETVK